MVSRTTTEFDVEQFLASSDEASPVLEFQRADVIFSQGDPGLNVLYVQRGGIKLSVVSPTGREAIIGIAGPGDFVGEECLAGHPQRLETATAISLTTVRSIDKARMARLLRREHDFSESFIQYMVRRNVRVEADLIDQLFNSSEKRLARALLLLARHGVHDAPHEILPNVSQEMLAEMVGTTRSRVNALMSKFRKRGFIEYRGGLRINSALLTGMVLNPLDGVRPSRIAKAAPPPQVRSAVRLRRS
jgi:CRP/FNR family transcriptional regulator, cyclic AMP receptor protein